MAEEARFRFFDIVDCGVYCRGEDVPAFSDISDCLQGLQQWASDGRDIINTATFEADNERDLKNVYFQDLSYDEHTGDFVLALWNESMHDEGSIYGIDPHNKPGNTEMLETNFGNRPAIPGMVSYFWFVPDENIFSSIKYNHSMNGKGNLDNYLKGFYLNKSNYRVKDNDGVVVGYSQNGERTADHSSMYPRFHSVSSRSDGIERELLAHQNQITRMLREEKLMYHREDDRTQMWRFFDGLLGEVPYNNGVLERTLKSEISYRPSDEELREIIHNYYADGAGNDYSTGFKYSTGKTIWLDRMNITFGYELPVHRNPQEIFAAQDLMHAIHEERSHLLNYLSSEG